MRRFLFLVALAGLTAAAVHGGPNPVRADGGVTVTVSSARPASTPGVPIDFTVTVTNTTAAPVTLSFSTGQMFDVVVSSPNGIMVWQWSRGKLFAQVLTSRTLAAGESITFAAQWNSRTENGLAAVTGVYVVTATLTAQTRIDSAPAMFVIGEEQALPGPGCVTLTSHFADGTPIELVAATFSPASALQSIWRQSGREWQGWSSDNAIANNLRTVDARDSLRVCLRGPATWITPA